MTTNLDYPKTQVQEILYILLKHGYATRADFFNKAHILNSPSGINILRKKGVDIDIKMVKTNNRFGRDVRYGVYSIPEKSRAKAIAIYNLLKQ